MLAALAWQIELGADEAIADAAIDRFTESAHATPAKGTPPAAPREPERAVGATADARLAQQKPVAQSTIPDGTDIAARATTLAELADALANWPGSDLRQGARSCVFADGNPAARVMIIGEAPGADEDRLGKPFVGRAGQLLDKMLAAIGLDRTAEDPAKAVYITNILPWRPPGNRTPTEAEGRAFLPFVLRHIALAQPEILLTLGNTPTKSLLSTTTGIRRMRGEWQRHGATDLPLLPSFHPAYLLRQPAEKCGSWADLLSLRRALDTNPPV